jgi:pimeloyl-ACP methyl ester carboxylesterase
MLNLKPLISHPNPAKSYTEAMQRAAALQGRDGDNVNPVGRTLLLTHGFPADRAVVWLHGYTNCPEQFKQLAQFYFDRGCNVLVPRFPRHGLKDRLTDATARLTAEEAGKVADEAVDIARGLGQQVLVGGLSMGGVITGWLAQQRDDIDLALLMAPAFGFKAIPVSFTRPAAGLIMLLPNFFQWWDPKKKADLLPSYGYPRHASRGLGHILRLSFATQDMARHHKPAARRISVLTNANDMAVNDKMTARVVRLWQAQGTSVQTHKFGKEFGLDHDFIDPGSPKQHIDVSYPAIKEMFT